jgi:cellulose synthase/poly-beta-1,6-N-acetylglucosamine synthase-like glycosyltransferase
MVRVLEFCLFFGFAGLIVYAYKGFDVFLSLLTIGRAKRGLASDPAFEPTVTIFIPAYNEEKVIAAKIENCLALDYPKEKLEIMVCSDCSGDATVAIAQRYAAQGITIFDYKERSGKTGLINKSIPRARGDIIVFTDANTMFAPDAVRSMVSRYVSESVGAVLGEVSLVVPSGGSGVDKEVAYRDSEARLKYKEGLFGAAIGGFGGFYSLRKALFMPLPPNAYSNDDLLLAVRVLAQGRKVVFDNAAVSHEETGVTVSEEFRRRIRIGAGNYQAFFLLLSLLNPFRGWVFLFYLSHKVLRWFSPFLFIAFFVSCLPLLDNQIVKATFLCQCIFYGTAVMAAIAGGRILTLPFVSTIYHFFAMNAAVFLGLFRYCRGIKSAAWESTPRSQG